MDRLYQLEGLQVRMRAHPSKRISLHRGPVPTSVAANQHWSMYFVHDWLVDEQRLQILTVIE